MRHLVGVQACEYLLAQALSEIGEDRLERQELEGNRALIRAPLRLLRRQGPGLGSMFGAAPGDASEQAERQAKLLENERQLEVIGDSQSALEMELECLKKVLAHPARYVRVEQKRLRMNTMHVLVEEGSADRAAEVDFSLAELTGAPTVRRAFILARFSRADLPARAINFDAAARYFQSSGRGAPGGWFDRLFAASAGGEVYNPTLMALRPQVRHSLRRIRDDSRGTS